MKYFAALGIALLVIAAASVGPWAPSPFTSQTGTNTTAADWRVALGVTSSASLTNAALVGGTVVNQTNTSLTASRLMVTDANKVPTNSAVTTTTLGYLDATSSIQTQLDAKPTASLTNLALLNGTNVFTGTNHFLSPVSVSSGGATSLLRMTNSGGSITLFSTAGSLGINFSGGNRAFFGTPSGGVSGFQLYSDDIIGWTTSTAGAGASDAALARNAAGVVEVNNGTVGVYRDIITRSLYATNLYATNLVIGGGSAIVGVLSATATLNFDLTALVVEDLTITVTGAASGDTVSIGVPAGSVTATVQFTGWVSAADTVTIRARTSVVGENPASGTFRATVTKF